MAQSDNEINLPVSFLSLFNKKGSGNKGDKGEKGDSGADPLITKQLQYLLEQFSIKYDALLDIREIKGDKGENGRAGTNGSNGINGINGNNGQDFEIIFINTLNDASNLVDNGELIINKVYLILENAYLFIATQNNDYKCLNEYLNPDLVNNFNIIQISQSDFSLLVNNAKLNIDKCYYINDDELFVKAISNENFIILNNHVNVEFTQSLIDENNVFLKYNNYTELSISIQQNTIKDDKIVFIDIDNSFYFYKNQNFYNINPKQLLVTEIFTRAGAEGYI